MAYSLLDNPWIPAVDGEGRRQWIVPLAVGERDSAGGPRWIDVDWGRPDLRIATYELLIGLFATALAPAGVGELLALARVPPDRDRLAGALAPLSPYMNLDGEGPRFQQDFAEIAGEANPPDALFMDAPGANTIRNGADLFVKRGRTPVLSRKAAAIALHALQAFAPSGGAGHRTSMRGGGPLTTLVVPPRPDLWRRIAANLPLLVEPERRPPDDLSTVFPWARSTRVSRGDVVTEQGAAHGTHWLQHYFGMPRRIRLVFEANEAGRACGLTGEADDVVVTGFRMEAYGTNYGFWRHPLSPNYEDKTQGLLPVHPRSGRIGYRDWVGCQFAGGEGGAASHPAETVTAYAQGVGVSLGPGRMLAAGYVTDNMKTEDFVEAEVPLVVLPNTHARDLVAETVQGRLVAAAELAARALRGALIESLGGDYKKTLIATAVERFWIETEGGFERALEDLVALYHDIPAEAHQDDAAEVEQVPVVEEWLACFRRAALRIFRETAPLDVLFDLPGEQRRRIVAANKSLHLLLLGYGKGGRALFGQMQLPPPSKPQAPAPGATGASP